MVNPWRYAGQYEDTTTGLYKMGARYYQPELGRWTQPDPSGLAGNAYAYVGGNPVNFVDPSGLFGIDVDSLSSALSAIFAGVGIFLPAAKIPAFIADSAIDVAATLFSDSDCKEAEIAFDLITNIATQLGGTVLDDALKATGEKLSAD